ncbi:MAG TPA: histidine phosphatase family protein [Bacilli bacterium]|nr:histidine phosphatase family protein [Bacilli bacterium]
MTHPTRITLIRHGETIWNRERRMQGSQDIPLSDTGLEQAEAVAKRLAADGTTYHHIYSSHLRRAHQTAATIAAALNLPHTVHEDLRERSFGDLEGHTRDQILDKYPDFFGPGPKPPIPGLETFEQVSARAHRVIHDLIQNHTDEHILIVSHGGTINAFLHAISDGAYGTGVNKLGTTSLTHVIHEKDKTWHIKKVGCTEHL